MFKPSHLKNSVHFRKGVEKFIHYKRHLLAPDALADIRRQLDALKALEAGRADRTVIGAAHKALEESCRAAVPGQVKEPGWLGENVEVLFTAIIIALGIRAYFLQPFKIPTGSMQPTLNGVTATMIATDKPMPSLPSQAWQWLINSRRYVEVKADHDDAIIGVTEKNFLLFFTSTKIHMQSGETLSVPATRAATLGATSKPWAFDGRGDRLIEPVPVKAGEVLVRAMTQGGDQLLVDKMSYHFRRPERGEVFVFNTKGIRGIENSPSYKPEYGSQHYIKRLCAVPGDTMEIHPDGRLFINGAVADSEGCQKVMSKQDGYNGYISGDKLFNKFSLKPGEFERRLASLWRGDARDPQPIFWAMGDNQANSADSRYWGPVPQVNLAGPALVVYWPLGNHFGWIH